MATLEDAAEELVIKLRGLDSEIEESEHKLQELAGRVEGAADNLEREFTALTEGLSGFLERMRGQQEQLHRQMEQTVQEANDSRQAVAEQGAEARSEIATGRQHLDGLAEHATGLQPGIESLVTQAAEEPARSLAERAAEVQEELARVMEEARDFLRDDVVGGLQQFVTDVTGRCEELGRSLAEEHTAALQAAFDEWAGRVDEVEGAIAAQGFEATQENTRAVVDWALGECQTGCAAQLDELRDVVEAAAGQLEDMAAEVGRSGEALVAQSGAELRGALTQTREDVVAAQAALGSVRDLLASYSFTGM